MRLVCAMVVTVALSFVWDRAQNADPSDAQRILRAHLSHGIGASAFDSDVWDDPTNAALIVGARSGAAVADLQRLTGHERDFSQRLTRLERAGFLRREGDRVRAAFPILIGKAQLAYSAIASQVASRIEKEMRANWRALLRNLNARGWQDWAYHFVWSQTMDSGFAWAALMKGGYVPPLSKVVVWVVHPAHPFKSGTNYYPDSEVRDFMLAVTWRPEAIRTINRIGGDWQIVWDAALTGPALPKVRERLRALGLVNRHDRLLVPVVRNTILCTANWNDLQASTSRSWRITCRSTH
jgi:hypothetical protein